LVVVVAIVAGVCTSGVVVVCHEALRPSLDRRPQGVPCSAFDELVVSAAGNRRVVVFSDGVLMTLGDGDLRGVAM
jgi:hypothetical protein